MGGARRPCEHGSGSLGRRGGGADKRSLVTAAEIVKMSYATDGGACAGDVVSIQDFVAATKLSGPAARMVDVIAQAGAAEVTLAVVVAAARSIMGQLAM